MTTIHDVAKRAGVSPVTVSRVINGASNVNASTRERVELAIKELSYLPNLAARSLRSRQTSTLALIVPDITNAFWTTVARGAEDAAQSEGYLVWLCNSDENLEKQNGYLNAVLQQRVDGVMIAPFDSDPANLKPLRDLNTPTVVIDREVHGWEVDTVRSDSVSGSYALVRHLTDLGHRRIAIISGPSATSTAEERVAGYYLAMEDAGIAIDQRLICRGEYRSLSGRELTDTLFEEGLEPTAIVAANNLIGMGVFEALQARGKRVPQDIALVCFDELPDLARFYPFLTVAVQTAYDIGINAAQLLVSRISSEAPLQPRRVILPTRLLLRHSCGRHLNKKGADVEYLPMMKDQTETILIQPLPSSEEERIRRYMGGQGSLLHAFPGRPAVDGSGRISLSDSRLRKTLRHQTPDRLPHIEASITNRALLEYVLERPLPNLTAITPADLATFAQRIGLDALACEIDWQPELQEVLPSHLARGKHSFPPPAFVEHFTRIEELLRATRSSSTGVYVTLSAFYDCAIKAIGAAPSKAFETYGAALVGWLDQLAGYQQQIIRSICDRFAPNLEFLVIRDQLLATPEAEALHPQLREAVFSRLAKVIQPAREHQIVVGIESSGSIAPFLDDLYEAGIGLIQSIDPRTNDFPQILEQWQGKLVFSGGFPAEYLHASTSETASIEAQVRQYCQSLENRPGVIFGVSPSLTAAIKPEQYLRMVQALRQYGTYKPVE